MLFVLLAACGSGDCHLSGLANGQVTAVIDDADYAASAVFTEAGSSIQVNLTPNAGWFSTVVLQVTEDGGDVATAVADAAWPIVVALGGDGGWATAYPDSGESFRTEADGGTMTLVEPPDDVTLAGCFSFTGTSEAGATVSVTEGQFVATPFVQ